MARQTKITGTPELLSFSSALTGCQPACLQEWRLMGMDFSVRRREENSSQKATRAV